MSNTQPARVVVVGSANLDVVLGVARMPRPGETLLAESAERHPGGKGLNQAVGSARAGATTTFVGALGRDPAGDTLSAVMESASIDRRVLRRIDHETGLAFIVVDPSAENMIVVASGANATMTELTDAEARVVSEADVLLMQLELPMSVVVEAARTARAANSAVVLNAAPAVELDDELLGLLDCLIVNEHEASQLAGLDDLPAASAALAKRVRRLVVTLGGEGAAVYDGGELVGKVTPPAVTPTDTTGAGDTFCGAFAAATAHGQDLLSAVRFATAAAALSVEKVGAVPSVPGRAAILAKLGENW